MSEHVNCDIVSDFRGARARLKLGTYERYLVEHIAARVERLLQKRDAGKRRVGDIPPVVPGAEGGRGVGHRARVRTTHPFEETAAVLGSEQRG